MNADRHHVFQQMMFIQVDLVALVVSVWGQENNFSRQFVVSLHCPDDKNKMLKKSPASHFSLHSL